MRVSTRLKHIIVTFLDFADDNTLYNIHALMTSSRNISVQTKRENRKPDFVFGNVTVKILEANQEKEG